MAQVCFYVLTNDTGFAPNPFHGWCTLLGCTPNYRNADLARGDYIAGVFRSGRPLRLVYVMEVHDVLDYDDYYQDRRFQKKKPRREGTWQERAGNNIYFLDSSGRYVQDKNAWFHTKANKKEQDKAHPTVFVGHYFAYFGEKAETDAALLLPERFHWCVPIGRAQIKYLPEESPDYDPFLSWAFSHGTGSLGLPRDREIDGERKKRGKCGPDLCDDETEADAGD